MTLLDQLLLPQRFAAGTIKDIRRIADATVGVGALANDLRGQTRPVRDWMKETTAIIASLRDEVAGVRGAVQPMSTDLDALRAAFAATNDQLERLREESIPQLTGMRSTADGLHREVERQRELIDALTAEIKEMGERLAAGITTLNATIEPLVNNADEVCEVLEPLQSATERMGRVAERLPGPGRKK